MRSNSSLRTTTLHSPSLPCGRVAGAPAAGELARTSRSKLTTPSASPHHAQRQRSGFDTLDRDRALGEIEGDAAELAACHAP
jgi:hypothetical protein